MWYVLYKGENDFISDSACEIYFFLSCNVGKCEVHVIEIVSASNNTVRDIEKTFLEEINIDCVTSITSTLSKHKL